MTRFVEVAGNSITWAVAGVVALALGLILALTTVSPARADQTIDISYTFPGLLPGVPEEQTGTYQLEQDARLVSLEWTDHTGLFTTAQLGVDVCQEACEINGAAEEFTAGELEVLVQVTLPTVAETNGAEGTVTGRLVFTAEDNQSALAATGAQISTLLLWGGAALTFVGLVIVTSRRRTSRPAQTSSRTD